MVTVIPRKIFMELASIKEDKEEIFSFKDFTDKVIHYSMVRDYLKGKPVKFVGSGSGRTAYFMPGLLCKDVSMNSPVCLKVANNIRGIEQNKGEKKIIDKYGSRTECFPEIYKYDKHGNIAMLVELGTDVLDDDFDQYFEELNNSFRNDFSEDTKKIIPRISEANDVYKAIKNLSAIHRQGNSGKPYVKSVLKDLESVAKRNKAYIVFYSIFEVLFKKGGIYDMTIGDFGDPDNWALMKRKNQDVIVPIDWGLTKEVAYRYYMD